MSKTIMFDGHVPLRAGCVASGANWGWRVGRAAWDEARSLGMGEEEPGDDALVSTFYGDDLEALDDPMVVDDIVDRSLDWLNERTDGGVWHFWDGDLFLSTDEELEGTEDGIYE